jgi:hypothetical protein
MHRQARLKIQDRKRREKRSSLRQIMTQMASSARTYVTPSLSDYFGCNRKPSTLDITANPSDPAAKNFASGGVPPLSFALLMIANNTVDPTKEKRANPITKMNAKPYDGLTVVSPATLGICEVVAMKLEFPFSNAPPKAVANTVVEKINSSPSFNKMIQGFSDRAVAAGVVHSTIAFTKIGINATATLNTSHCTTESINEGLFIRFLRPGSLKVWVCRALCPLPRRLGFGNVEYGSSS